MSSNLPTVPWDDLHLRILLHYNHSQGEFCVDPPLLFADFLTACTQLLQHGYIEARLVRHDGPRHVCITEKGRAWINEMSKIPDHPQISMDTGNMSPAMAEAYLQRMRDGFDVRMVRATHNECNQQAPCEPAPPQWCGPTAAICKDTDTVHRELTFPHVRVENHTTHKWLFLSHDVACPITNQYLGVPHKRRSLHITGNGEYTMRGADHTFVIDCAVGEWPRALQQLGQTPGHLGIQFDEHWMCEIYGDQVRPPKFYKKPRETYHGLSGRHVIKFTNPE